MSGSTTTVTENTAMLLKKADLKVGDYYGKDGVFPTEYNPSGEETTAESTTEL